jgi:hypothetical protein
LVIVEINYDKKKKGAYTKEDASLKCPKTSFLNKIMRRLQWRVAQSQYDLLGLLSACMITRKLLMKVVTLGPMPSPLRRTNSEQCLLTWMS